VIGFDAYFIARSGLDAKLDLVEVGSLHAGGTRESLYAGDF
jgi:hypothetical protein